ncbi:MAG TPA: HAD family hydrolase [Blastocatellia bacterium]|nr:HAD family hydrolase [Blastocatellia bacterium]
MVTNEIRERAKRVKLLIMDCDGVLTDGRIVLLSETEETKFFDARDGHGIRMAARAGLRTAIISGRTSFAVRTRARDLGIHHLVEGSLIKIDPYLKILSEEKLEDADVCYIGDDVTDIPLMRRAGLAVAVADATVDTKNHAHLITELGGGRGAVRELIELILNVQGKWQQVMARYLE